MPERRKRRVKVYPFHVRYLLHFKRSRKGGEAMKDNTSFNNPYATNKGGKIDAPKKQSEQPKSTVNSKSNDLRAK